ncbi:HEAT repeat domain-containing protein [Aestuariimicrobium ganziense]|uniref:HEAT repeat domain-containing protein n=1 Tax=Aestuariimicrobium ganziense TaxID=2773677 RepID=UPI0019439C48|nr:HEAT repeat domain-containing protein [Aestuariimicrobium ganziense]
MTSPDRVTQLRELLSSDDNQSRLSATLAAGTHPQPGFVEVLIERCRIEPDFFVRDTLSWALLMHPCDQVVKALATELWRAEDQARSQALHTLSKIGDPATWPLITTDMLHSEVDEVARTAWRAAAAVVPDDQRAELARDLVRELGRGDLSLQRALSRSIASLGETALAALSDVEHAAEANDAARAHAIVTSRLIADPDLDFELALEVAKAQVAHQRAEDAT